MPEPLKTDDKAEINKKAGDDRYTKLQMDGVIPLKVRLRFLTVFKRMACPVCFSKFVLQHGRPDGTISKDCTKETAALLEFLEKATNSALFSKEELEVIKQAVMQRRLDRKVEAGMEMVLRLHDGGAMNKEDARTMMEPFFEKLKELMSSPPAEQCKPCGDPERSQQSTQPSAKNMAAEQLANLLDSEGNGSQEEVDGELLREYGEEFFSQEVM